MRPRFRLFGRVFGRMFGLLFGLLFGLPLALAGSSAVAANRLDDIRARGVLHCGVWPHVAGFAVEREGQFSGFEIDLCRAVAAAVLGDAGKVSFVAVANVAEFAKRRVGGNANTSAGVDASARVGASAGVDASAGVGGEAPAELGVVSDSAGEVDIVIRRLTWTLNREASNGVAFGPVVFHDGQGFLVPTDSNISHAAQLSGERVCVLNMEHHPRTLRDHFRDAGGSVHMVMVENDAAAEQALRSGRCRAYSADLSWLAAARAGFAEGVERYALLPETISREPLAPLMRAEDTDLARVVEWMVYSMIDAEERGVSSKNVADDASASAELRAVIGGVGNYGEVFDRNLGAASAIRLERGLNRLSTQDGLMYAPPLDR